MADHRRRTLHRLIRRIADRQEAVEFYQLVRLLERHLLANDDLSGRVPKPVGQHAADQEPSIRFRADTANRTRPSSSRALANLPDVDAESAAEVVTSFMNLIGTTGVLPQDYTTLILERIRAGDTALRDYLDVFHQRLTELAYQVWERSRPDIAWERSKSIAAGENRQRADDSFTVLLRSLAGDPDQSGGRHLEQARLYFSAFHSNLRRPALSLESMLLETFQVPVSVQQFHPRSVLLAEEDQLRLPGRPDRHVRQARLGFGMIAGRRVPVIQTRLLIRLGPLDYHQFCEFLPNGRRYQPLRDLVRSFVGLECELEVELQLDPQQTPQLRPGRQPGQSRLGWNTWLGGGSRQDLKRQMRYIVHD